MQRAGIVAVGVAVLIAGAGLAGAQPYGPPPLPGPPPPPGYPPPPPPPPAPRPSGIDAFVHAFTATDPADPPVGEIRMPYVFVAAHFGALAPLGIVGGEVGVGWRWGQASAGVGLGLQGMEVAGLFEVLLLDRTHLIVPALGAGLSHGPGTHDLDVGWSDGEPEHNVEFGPGTLWGNVELDVEHRSSSRISLRGYLGISVPLVTDCFVDTAVDREPCTASDRRELESWLPYAGIAAVFRIL